MPEETKRLVKEANERADAEIVEANKTMKLIKVAYYVQGYSDDKEGVDPMFTVLEMDGGAPEDDDDDEDGDDDGTPDDQPSVAGDNPSVGEAPKAPEQRSENRDASATGDGKEKSLEGAPRKLQVLLLPLVLR